MLYLTFVVRLREPKDRCVVRIGFQNFICFYFGSFFEKKTKKKGTTITIRVRGHGGGQKTQIQQWRRGHSAAGEKETQQQNVVGIIINENKNNKTKNIYI